MSGAAVSALAAGAAAAGSLLPQQLNSHHHHTHSHHHSHHHSHSHGGPGHGSEGWTDDDLLSGYALAIGRLQPLPDGTPSPAQVFNAASPLPCCGRLRPGLVLTHVNGASVRGLSRKQCASRIAQSGHPFSLTFLFHPLARLRTAHARLQSQYQSLALRAAHLVSSLSLSAHRSAERRAQLEGHAVVLSRAYAARCGEVQSLRAQVSALASQLEQAQRVQRASMAHGRRRQARGRFGGAAGLPSQAFGRLASLAAAAAVDEAGGSFIGVGDEDTAGGYDVAVSSSDDDGDGSGDGGIASDPLFPNAGHAAAARRATARIRRAAQAAAAAGTLQSGGLGAASGSGASPLKGRPGRAPGGGRYGGGGITGGGTAERGEVLGLGLRLGLGGDDPVTGGALVLPLLRRLALSSSEVRASLTAVLGPDALQAETTPLNAFAFGSGAYASGYDSGRARAGKGSVASTPRRGSLAEASGTDSDVFTGRRAGAGVVQDGPHLGAVAMIHSHQQALRAGDARAYVTLQALVQRDAALAAAAGARTRVATLQAELSSSRDELLGARGELGRACERLDALERLLGDVVGEASALISGALQGTQQQQLQGGGTAAAGAPGTVLASKPGFGSPSGPPQRGSPVKAAQLASPGGFALTSGSLSTSSSASASHMDVGAAAAAINWERAVGGFTQALLALRTGQQDGGTSRPTQRSLQLGGLSALAGPSQDAAGLDSWAASSAALTQRWASSATVPPLLEFTIAPSSESRPLPDRLGPRDLWERYKASQKRLALLSASFEERCEEVGALQERCRGLANQLQAAQHAATSASALVSAATGIPYLGGAFPSHSVGSASGSRDSRDASGGATNLSGLRLGQLVASASVLPAASPSSAAAARRMSRAADMGPPPPQSSGPSMASIIAAADRGRDTVTAGLGTSSGVATDSGAESDSQQARERRGLLGTLRRAASSRTMPSSNKPPGTPDRSGRAPSPPAPADTPRKDGIPPRPAASPTPSAAAPSTAVSSAAAALFAKAPIAAASALAGGAATVTAAPVAAVAAAAIIPMAAGAAAAAALSASSKSASAYDTTASSSSSSGLLSSGPTGATSPSYAAPRAVERLAGPVPTSNPFAPASAAPAKPAFASSATSAKSGPNPFAPSQPQRAANPFGGGSGSPGKQGSPPGRRPEPPRGRLPATGEDSDESSDDGESDGSSSDGGGGGAKLSPAQRSAAVAAAANPFKAASTMLFKAGVDSRADVSAAKRAMTPAEQAFALGFPTLGGQGFVRARKAGGLFGGGSSSWSDRFIGAGRGSLHFFAREGDASATSKLDLHGVVDADIAAASECGRPYGLYVVSRENKAGLFIAFTDDGTRDAFLALLLGCVAANKEAAGL